MATEFAVAALSRRRRDFSCCTRLPSAVMENVDSLKGGGGRGMIGAVCDLLYTYRCAYVNLHVHAHTSTALGQIYPHNTI